MKNPPRYVLTLVLAVLVLLWGTTWAAIRVGLQGVPPFTGASIRFVIGAAVLLILAPVFGVSFGRSRRELQVWIANGLFLFVGSYGTVYWAEQWVPSGIAAVLFSTFPLFVAVMAHFLVPGERLGPRVLAGIAIGLAGVAIIYSEDFGRLGDARAARAAVVFMISPMSAALGNVLVKRWGKGIHPISITTIPMVIGAVVLGAAAALLERDLPTDWNPTSIGIIVYLAIFGTVVTFVLYFWALEHLPVTRIALIAYFTPVMAVVIGAVFLGETVTPRVLFGAGAVIGGVAVAGRSRRRSDPPPADDRADDRDDGRRTRPA